MGGDVTQRLRPEAGRVGIEPQDDLGLAPGDDLREPVGERRPDRGLGRRRRRGVLLRRNGRQPLTAFFSPEPAVKRGTLEALIWIGSPVRGCTP